MRLFIAFDIPQDINLKKIQKYIADGTQETDGLDAILGTDAKFVPTKMHHITLVFIGEQPENKIQSIKTALLEAIHDYLHEQSRGMIEFNLEPEAAVLGANAVVMSGTIAERAFELQKNIVKKLNEHGVHTDERLWIPHITLGRINPASAIENKIEPIEEFLETVQVPDELDMFTLESITLYDATSDGYKALDTLKI